MQPVATLFKSRWKPCHSGVSSHTPGSSVGIGKGASVWMLLSRTRLEESMLAAARALCYIKHAYATSAFIQRSETEPSRVLRVSKFLFVYFCVILQFVVPKEFVKKLKHLARLSCHGCCLLIYPSLLHPEGQFCIPDVCRGRKRVLSWWCYRHSLLSYKTPFHVFHSLLITGLGRSTVILETHRCIAIKCSCASCPWCDAVA